MLGDLPEYAWSEVFPESGIQSFETVGKVVSVWELGDPALVSVETLLDALWGTPSFPGLDFEQEVVMQRTFPALSLVALLSACAASAQDVVPNRADALEVRAQYIADLDTLYGKFYALAGAFPAETYSWRPAPGVRSVGEVFMHVASEYYVWVPAEYGATPSPVVGGLSDSVMKNWEGMSTKADVLKYLKDAHSYARATIMGLDPATLTGPKKLFGGPHTIIEMSFSMAGDLHEHLGQLIAYARMNGVKPPWSK
jgi:hypothetical protein